MANLAGFLFTNGSDLAESLESLVSGWVVSSGVTVNALAGNDSITGSSSGSSGFGNTGTINTGNGNDSITGSSVGRIGIFNFNFGTIDTGNGNDTITGSGGTGTGIVNNGTIDTGNGNDTITGSSGAGIGIFNFGTIDTGNGDDSITGSGNSGIINEVTIDTGAGNDTVDALQGGFRRNGTTNLGTGNDTLKGFGTGTFNGGDGIDKILFGAGEYEISGGIITSGGIDMNVTGFESIGGAGGGLFDFANGTLTVDAGGVATFAV